MATKPKQKPLGALIDELWELREVERDIEAKLKEAKAKTDAAEEVLAERLKSEQATSARGAKASLSVTYTTVGRIVDWDTFWKYLVKSRNTQLIQKRISDPAFRELLSLGRQVPGTEAFDKRRLNLRSL